MASVEEAREILRILGLPKEQYNVRSAKVLLALCGLTPADPWSAAVRAKRTITLDLMAFISEHWGMTYKPNSRETIRRKTLHQFVQARIADYNPFDPTLPTNSKDAHYAMTNEALAAIRLYGTAGWEAAAAQFVAQQGALAALYATQRAMHLIPVTLSDGSVLTLSPGKHNKVQRAIVEEFIPRFAQKARLLYLGDTAKKGLLVEAEEMERLGIPMTEHDKLPDVVCYDPDRDWLFLIEAVTSHGPMSPKRIFELREMLKGCSAGPVYVSAFPNLKEFKRWVSEIAWDTEVWVAEMPDHMIHYNGDRFLGPRGPTNPD